MLIGLITPPPHIPHSKLSYDIVLNLSIYKHDFPIKISPMCTSGHKYAPHVPKFITKSGFITDEINPQIAATYVYPEK